MLDHVADAVEDVVIVVVGLPHEGRSADDTVLLVHIGFVKQPVKENLRDPCGGS